MSVPRLFFATLMPIKARKSIEQLLCAHQIDRLGLALFPPQNWHQSWSERIFRPTDADIAALMAVGDAVNAHACTLSFNRIDSQLTSHGRIQWTLRARGRPKAFIATMQRMQHALRHAGYDAIATGVTPHVTLSYHAPETLDKITVTPTIDWTINNIAVGDGWRCAVPLRRH